MQNTKTSTHTIEAKVHEVGESPREPAKEAADEVIGRVKEKLAPIDQWIRTLAREQPMVALAGAVGVGYLIGRLIRRVN